MAGKWAILTCCTFAAGMWSLSLPRAGISTVQWVATVPRFPGCMSSCSASLLEIAPGLCCPQYHHYVLCQPQTACMKEAKALSRLKWSSLRWISQQQSQSHTNSPSLISTVPVSYQQSQSHTNSPSLILCLGNWEGILGALVVEVRRYTPPEGVNTRQVGINYAQDNTEQRAALTRPTTLPSLHHWATYQGNSASWAQKRHKANPVLCAIAQKSVSVCTCTIDSTQCSWFMV